MRHSPHLLALLFVFLTACGPEIAGPEPELLLNPASEEIDCTVTNPPPECTEDGGQIGSNGE